MNTYNTLTEAVIAAINELKSAGTVSAHQITALIRNKTNQDEWQVVGCEARPNGQNIKYWINHDDVRRALGELYANNELDSLGFTGRQYNGTYLEYSFDVSAAQPADPTTPTFLAAIDPSVITSVPATYVPSVNRIVPVRRILNAIDNLKNIGGPINLKRVQSAIKTNGVTCEDIYFCLAGRHEYTLVPNGASDYYSQYEVF